MKKDNKQEIQNIEDFQTLLGRLDLKSLLALQVIIAQQALRVSLSEGLPEAKEVKSNIILPNKALVL